MAEYKYAPNLKQPERALLKRIGEEEVKEDIYNASLSLAAYLEAEKISNVMFLDKSARQSYIGLKEIWKKEYADEPEPNIYFINPDPLKYEVDFPELAEEFFKKYKNIKPEEQILLYDNCIHSGSTTTNIKEFFKYLGFSDVRVAITSVPSDFPEEKKAELDLICLPNRAKLGCNPFGSADYVKKSGLLVVKPRREKDVREIGRLEHKAIKDVFKED